MSRWENWERPLAFLMWSVLPIVTIFSVFAYLDQGGHYNRVILIGSLGSIAFAIPLLLRFTERLIVPWALIVMIYASLINHLIGDFLMFYTIYPWFDKVSHILSSSTVAIIVFMFLVMGDHYIRSISIPVKLMPYLVVTTASLLGVIWEIFEWFAGYMGVEMQFCLEDTVYDLVTNFIGASLAAYVSYRYVLQKGVEQVVLRLEVGDFMERIAAGWERKMGKL